MACASNSRERTSAPKLIYLVMQTLKQSIEILFAYHHNIYLNTQCIFVFLFKAHTQFIQFSVHSFTHFSPIVHSIRNNYVVRLDFLFFSHCCCCFWKYTSLYLIFLWAQKLNGVPNKWLNQSKNDRDGGINSLQINYSISNECCNFWGFKLLLWLLTL